MALQINRKNDISFKIRGQKTVWVKNNTKGGGVPVQDSNMGRP